MIKKQLQKNLYDLEFNEVLNHQNTLVIILATFIIGFFLGSFSLEDKITVLIIGFLVILIVLYIFSRKLKKIKEKISVL